jgi:hypothetical protein
MPGIRWTTTVLDCSDPVELADFYAALIGGARERVTADFHVVRSGTAWLAAQRVRSHTAPSWSDAAVPKQMRLDLLSTTRNRCRVGEAPGRGGGD